MIKTMIKGLLSTIVGGIVFGCLFLWQKDSGILENLFFSITAGFLGYCFIAPLIMSEEEMEKFENRIEKWIEDEGEKK